MTYPENIIKVKFDLAIKNIDVFYKQPLINYASKITNTDTFVSEFIASEILKAPSFFDNIKPITRESKNKSYSTKSHYDGTIEIRKTIRNEENYAKNLHITSFFEIEKKTHKIIDFQIPLQNVKRDIAGKIDLMLFNENTLYLIELKYGDNTETLLRAVLEVYTYFKIINHEKLKIDYLTKLEEMENIKININEIVIKPAVMVVNDPKKKDCRSFIELEELERGDRINLKELATKLNITFFKSADGETFEMIKF